MRPIKFRVWCKDFGEWEKDPVLLSPDGVIHHVNQHGRINVIRPDNHIVQWFTGLLDSKGKEIYEGDIVNVESFCLYEIYWDEQMARFDLCQIDSKELYLLDIHENVSWPSNRMTVIGNIFENEELLK